MKEIRTSSLHSLFVFGLPIIITAIYTKVENSIGPVVFVYSIVGGILFGLTWIKTLIKKLNRVAGLIIGVPIMIVGIVLLFNFFIWVSWIMGEMDYSLL
ncbi:MULTISPECIES: hypothetical protein [unclassified Prosthecochloris]|uniref:hypothetical protein n=1 Tax=unclassified Prosthecochloris TaxID=2632826 RepID=UPI00223E3F25|nr:MULTISPECIES: hypothetical protein [unclassified Prosthecochloris]UZJ36593.1 hypothetical protein OO005_07410 [Prosthecochloris sp. SCSIO W1103]